MENKKTSSTTIIVFLLIVATGLYIVIGDDILEAVQNTFADASRKTASRDVATPTPTSAPKRR